MQYDLPYLIIRVREGSGNGKERQQNASENAAVHTGKHNRMRTPTQPYAYANVTACVCQCTYMHRQSIFSNSVNLPVTESMIKPRTTTSFGTKG